MNKLESILAIEIEHWPAKTTESSNIFKVAKSGENVRAAKKGEIKKTRVLRTLNRANSINCDTNLI